MGQVCAGFGRDLDGSPCMRATRSWRSSCCPCLVRMTARFRLSVVCLLLIVARASAQSSTDDGIRALERGDFQRAAEILKPLAEDWRSRDAAAQFFLAGLYESGRGVAADPLRACALYMRASGALESPFSARAMPLFAALAGRSREFEQECLLLGSVGFDHGFEPALFDLSPGHFVQWTLAAVSVTHDGRTRRHELGHQHPGTRFLPLHHTRLAAGPAGPDARDFVQLFMWIPSKPAEWQLWWHVYEVVGDDLVRVDTSGPILTAEGERPPSRDGFDVREYAALRVDDQGHAEWAVLKGPGARAERIESEAERREVRDAALARERAKKSVDWNRRHAVKLPPSFAYTDADGCGLAHLYAWTADRAEVIIVSATVPQSDAPAQSVSYNLDRDRADIHAEVRRYSRAQHRFDFCSDVRLIDASNVPETWQAVAGTVTVELSAPGIRARRPSLRRATVTLRDLVLRNSTGTMVRAPGAIRLTAIVGGFEG